MAPPGVGSGLGKYGVGSTFGCCVGVALGCCVGSALPPYDNDDLTSCVGLTSFCWQAKSVPIKRDDIK